MVYKTGKYFGQIARTSGFEGAVLVRLEKNFTEYIPGIESVFVEIDGRPVPFFIEWSEQSVPGMLRLKFTGYSSVDMVEKFKECRVFLTKEYAGIQQDTDFNILLNYTVLDQDKKQLGIIKEIIFNPGQLLLSVYSPCRNEILVPLHNDLILAIDDERKTIMMEIPEGLAEINS